MKILVVDDLSFMRSLIKDILITGGHEVIGEAQDGREALIYRRAYQPDVILLDINMPRMDGLETLRRIKKEEPGALVIMCSSLGDQSRIIQAIRLGASDFVVKPFKKERLLSALRKVLGKNESS